MCLISARRRRGTHCTNLVHATIKGSSGKSVIQNGGYPGAIESPKGAIKLSRL